MPAPATTAIWFRHDLRIHDNPALHRACQSEGPVKALFIVTPSQWSRHHLSPARLALMHAALGALRRELAQRGIPLDIHTVADFSEIPDLFQTLIAAEPLRALVVNREYCWDEVQRDRAVAALCQRQGVDWISCHGSVVVPPGQVLTRQGQPYKVFTPFKRTWLDRLGSIESAPLPPPPPRAAPLPCEDVPLFPEAAAVTLRDWPSDEDAASKQLDAFLHTDAAAYHQQRDLPALDATSRLSPCLTLGLLSPTQCLHRARLHNQGALADGSAGLTAWINELVWREFYLHVASAFPEVCKHQPFRPATDRLPWCRDDKIFATWSEGRTGFPLVDAAMQQLLQTHWMHNRLRMVTAMFLTKYLFVDWRLGEAFFMRHLIDGHFPSNNGGWQWSASTGTDAAPYFRVLNPVRQAQRFDPDARFIKHFLPRLATLPPAVIHAPGHPALLATGYPPPALDLGLARQRSLAHFKAL